MSSPSLDSVIQDPARIAAVRELGVLNSAVHEPLDAVTRQAAEAVQAPVASISLLDGENEHFVAVHGAGAAAAAGLRQCPVERSICQFTVAAGEPLRIPDLREDSRFRATIDLGGLEIVAYLGVPLRLRDGAVAGSLCVIDGRPRAWSSPEVTILTELADSVAGFLALRSQVLGRVLDDPAGVPGETLFLARCTATRTRHLQGRSAMYRIEFEPPAPPRGAAERDRVVRRAAGLLAETVGATNVIGRLNDGAFAVFAHELRDERDALRLAARMRCALREAGDVQAGGDATRIGIALCDAPGETAAELLRRAEHVIRGAAGRGVVTEVARRVA